MSEFVKGLLAAVFGVIVLPVALLYFVVLIGDLLWGGVHLPPARGWTKRQMRRMDEGKSPGGFLWRIR